VSAARYLVTGGAGFIGSHLALALAAAGQQVRVFDDFSSGRLEHLAGADALPGVVEIVRGDLRDAEAVRAAAAGVEVIFHEGAIASVPRSLVEPTTTLDVNVKGLLNTLEAARSGSARRVVIASSSAIYGDTRDLPLSECLTPRPLSPYAAHKLCDEQLCAVYGRLYGLETVALRYFNVFGPRQDPEGAYAAVVPRWAAAMLRGDTVFINGDGETSRDFCYVENVVQANLLAGTAPPAGVAGEVFNIACGEQATLNQVYAAIRGLVARHHPAAADAAPEYSDFRPGDVRHSLADIGKARRTLGYEPGHTVERGLAEAVAWYAGALLESGAGEARPVRAGDQAGRRPSQPFRSRV